jgi:hypothetical protein
MQNKFSGSTRSLVQEGPPDDARAPVGIGKTVSDVLRAEVNHIFS